MAKQEMAVLNVRMPKADKIAAEELCKQVGLTMSAVVNMVFKQFLFSRVLPFQVAAVDYYENTPLPITEYSRSFDNLEELWKDLEI